MVEEGWVELMAYADTPDCLGIFADFFRVEVWEIDFLI